MSDTPAKVPSSEAREWRQRLDKADRRQKSWHVWWEAAKEAYAPGADKSPESYKGDIHTNRIFTIVERKSAELFYQRPEIMVAPSALLEQIPQGDVIASTHHTLINEKLGLDGVNIKTTARRAIFDYLLYGAGWTKIGYRAHTTEVPVTTTDPITGEAGIDVQPVVVKGECFWENVSPRQVLIPDEYTSTEFDKAPWLAMRFEVSLAQAKRMYGKALPEDVTPTESGEDTKFDFGDTHDGEPAGATIRGVEVWYRRSVFSDDEAHPDVLWQMTLIDGVPEPVQHRPSPYQTKDAQGRLTPDSMIGYPLHPLVIRAVTDAAYLASDVAIALPLVNELDTFRSQMVQQRDATIARYYYNIDTLPSEQLEKIVASPIGGMIGLPAEAFGQPGGPIQPMPHGPFPRENFSFNDYIDQDLSRTHAIDAMASGTSTESGQTATEANLRQSNVNVRLGWEQSFVADWFMQGVAKFSSLLQKFAPAEDVAAMVGVEKAGVWETWRRVSPSRLSFTMAPDSSLRNDTPMDRKQMQDLYTYLANDPSLNRAYITKKLLHKFHLDPTQALLPPDQVPQPKPAPPSLSLSFKGEDLNPLAPQAPIVLDLLTKAGVQIDPAAIANAMQLGLMAMQAQAAKAEAERETDGQPPHGGKVAAAESLDKHAAAETGAMPGSGAMGPMMGDPMGFA